MREIGQLRPPATYKSNHHVYCSININNFFRYDLNHLTPGHVQLLPNSPAQQFDGAILTFYAILPSGKIIPKHILGTIFVNQQENILANEITVQNLTEIYAPVSERENLTIQQRENRVAILLFNFRASRVSMY